MRRVALIGAGGKMGKRIGDKLSATTQWETKYVEVKEERVKLLKEMDFKVTPLKEALMGTDIVILAVPDTALRETGKKIVPQLKPNTIVIGLDPAAFYAEYMPKREDITYFIVHPCHPPLFHDEREPEAQRDWFGGLAKQDIVCCLYQGLEEHYQECLDLAEYIFGPIKNSYRLTLEQMILLEPTLVESFTSTLVMTIKEAYEEVVKRGVPKEAALGFLMGHLRVQFAVIFGYADFPFSDANYTAIMKAKELIFKEDWKENLFDEKKIRESVMAILRENS